MKEKREVKRRGERGVLEFGGIFWRDFGKIVQENRISREGRSAGGIGPQARKALPCAADVPGPALEGATDNRSGLKWPQALTKPVQKYKLLSMTGWEMHTEIGASVAFSDKTILVIFPQRRRGITMEGKMDGKGVEESFKSVKEKH